MSLVKKGYQYLCRWLIGLRLQATIKENLSEIISLVSERIEVRISVDIPTGLSESQIDDELYFDSDFCYLAGIPKQTVLRGILHLPESALLILA